MADGTSWQGEKALAYYTSSQLAKGPATNLNVQSQAFVRSQEKARTDRLQAENAQ